MHNKTPTRISVTTESTFWEVFSASIVLIKYRWPLMILHAVFPLAGAFVLVASFMINGSPRPGDYFTAFLGFCFTPLVTALAVWSSRRRNKLAHGSFTYTFDSEGMHTSGESITQTIGWSAILCIRRSKKFLFVFLSPSRAHCIPLRSIGDPHFFDDLRSIAGGLTNFRP